MDTLDPISRFILISLAVIVGCALMAGVLWLIYYSLTLPLRRKERARLFLDMLELGISEGGTPESAVVKASSSRDDALGARFHLLAAQIEQGQSLGAAVASVPHLVPPEVAAMIRSGERLRDVRLVLPACRKILQDSVSQVNAALNYLLLLTFVFSPLMIFLWYSLKMKVVPSFEQIFVGMLEAPFPPFTRFVFDYLIIFSLALAFIIGLLWLVTAAYIAGPRLRSALRRVAPYTVDAFLYLLPWRRKRIHRNFAHFLALLLDAGVPEVQAVKLAAEATDNEVILGKAATVAEALARGVALPEAIQAVEGAPDARWRLKNALAGGAGFTKALAGWFETLDAKADQQEQTAAQLATTGLVLFNGLVVGLTASAIFLLLVQVLQEAVLW